MKKLYWIDSFAGYPDEIVDASVAVYDELYGGFAARAGHRFVFVHLEQLHVSTGPRHAIFHAEHGDLLAQPGGAYVGLVHPDPDVEKKLETIYRMIAASGVLRLLNHAEKFPMVCKDKFYGIDLAARLGLATPPTALLGTGEALEAQLDFAEATVGRYPMFIRPKDLTGGMGTAKLHERAELRRFLQHPPYPGRNYILQPHVAIRTDYRVYLERREIIACRRREPRHGELTTTIDGGDSCEAPEPVREASRRLAAHLETRYLCVDWLWDGADYWFCEFETGGGFKDLAPADRDRVAAAFFGRLAE